MGCVGSKIDKEGVVHKCKERKKLMKQLVALRGEFASAQMAYLRSLRNTGITLRQFTEVESLELEDTPFIHALPRSPPPPLPPSPPPPPPFSPDLRRVAGDQKAQPLEKHIRSYQDNSFPPSLTLVQSPTWEFWDPFVPPPPIDQKKIGNVQEEGDEDWADTKTEFEEEKEEEVEEIALTPHQEKSPPRELMDDNSSMMSWYTKDTDMAMLVWRNKKTLAGIVKELDDYFLKASEGVKEIAVLLEATGGNHLQQCIKESKRKSCKSAKVFSALSWSWSSKSFQFSRDSVELHASGEACKPGAHCATLDKLYAEEQKLYEKVKEEGIAQLQYLKKTLLLQKQEAEAHDSTQTEKTLASIEILQSEISCLQQSITTSCSSILTLRDKELHPQLVHLSSGLMQVWRTMKECHQIQNHIAQQVNHLSDHLSTEPTSDYHIQATAQLETEVTAWYNSFCKLLKSQREYVRALTQWVRLTDCLLVSQSADSSLGIHTLCEEWQLALDRLPDKVPSEAIKNFLSVIHSIMLQQAEEHKLQMKSDRLEQRLKKDMHSLMKMENKFQENPSTDLSLNHPLSVKRSKTDAFKKRVEEEKAKYLNAVQVSRAMNLNNLNTSLPNVFQALTGFSSVCAEAYEAIYGHARPTEGQDESSQFEPV